MTVTWDPLHKGPDVLLTSGNLQANVTGLEEWVRATVGRDPAAGGVWRWRYTAPGGSGPNNVRPGFGMMNANANAATTGTDMGAGPNEWAFRTSPSGDGTGSNVYHNGFGGDTWIGQIGGTAFYVDLVWDAVNKTLAIYYNGSSVPAYTLSATSPGATGAPVGTDGVLMYPAFCSFSNASPGSMSENITVDFVGPWADSIPGTPWGEASTADFTYTPAIGVAPLSVDFTDASTGGVTSWLWDFGDGTTSTEQNPTHVYDGVGRYTVTLTATNDFGSSTKTVTHAVASTLAPARMPCIAWNNLLNADGVTLVASSEQSGFAKENAADWRPYTWWKPNDGEATFELQFASAQAFNCFAVYGHDLGSHAASITLQYSTDGGTTWLDAAPAVSPAGTEVIYRRFVTTMASRIRFLVESAVASRFACLFVGQDMQLERGCRVGFAPPSTNRSTQLTNTVSQNGVFLGRSVLYQGARVDLKLDFLTEDFITESWMPFVEHAEQFPWFLLWDESQHSDEGAWCVADGAIPGCAFTSYGLMNAGISGMARIE